MERPPPTTLTPITLEAVGEAVQGGNGSRDPNPPFESDSGLEDSEILASVVAKLLEVLAMHAEVQWEMT